MQIDILNEEDTATVLGNMLEIEKEIHPGTGRQPSHFKAETAGQLCTEFPDKAEEYVGVLALSIRALLRSGFDVVKRGTWVPRQKLRVSEVQKIRTRPTMEKTVRRRVR